MAFQFSLAAVLRVRESMETREERALQSIQLEVARTLQQIERLGVAIGGAHQARERALQQTISGGHLHSLLWEEQAAEQQLKLMLGQLQVLEQAREQQMKVYQSGSSRARDVDGHAAEAEGRLRAGAASRRAEATRRYLHGQAPSYRLMGESAPSESNVLNIAERSDRRGDAVGKVCGAWGSCCGIS